MDAVCIKGGWDVIIERDEAERLTGILVYHHRKYYGFDLILMPPMTAYNGIYVLPLDGLSKYSFASHQNKVTEALISRLPKHSLYYQQYHPSFKNWLPLYWKGYKETTRYTYTIDSREGKEVLKKGLRDNLRRSIKNSEKACTIVEIDIDTFLNEAEQSFAKRNKPMPINKAVLRKLCETFCETGQIKIRACKHADTGNYLSGAVIAMDKNTTYYLSSFFHPEAKPSGTMSHVIWDSIFSSEGRLFDFEGSIIKEVEFYFRSFGGELTPHYRIFSVPNPLLRVGLSLFKPNFFA